MEDRTPLRHNNERQVGAGCPPARHQLFPESHPQEVADLGSDFGLASWIAKHPGLTAILIPDSNAMKDRTPLWHNNQRQVGAGCPPARHQLFFESHPQKVADLGSDFGLLDCKTPWLGSHPGPQFQYHGGQNTFVA